MNQKGISSIVIILIIVGVLVVAGGIWAWQSQKEKPVACTQDTKLCPGGSYVSRTGPNCEFATCPEVKDETANWKTYRNEEYGFEVKYPAGSSPNVTDDTPRLFIIRFENQQKIAYYTIHIIENTEFPKLSNFISNPKSYEKIKTEKYNSVNWTINWWRGGAGAEKNPIAACFVKENYIFEIHLDSESRNESLNKANQILSAFKFTN